jgi:hypothetical protein
MAFRIPLLAALLVGAAAVQAQAPEAAPPVQDPPKAAPKKAPKPAKKAATKNDPKAKSATYATGPKELRDKDGNVIPTDPAAYPIDSALPRKK